jgi:hypothetical protein
LRRLPVVLFALLFCVAVADAQISSTAQPSISIPHVIRYSGAVPLAIPAAQRELHVTFRLFGTATGGRLLWQETQTVAAESGKFAALIGSATASGVPDYWFSANQARWLEVQVESESPLRRVQLTAVPYAMKAANAETLGGKPLSAFVLRNTSTSANSAAAAVLPMDTAAYATLGANSFVGDQAVNGSVNVTGYMNSALATVISPLVVNQLLWVKATASTGGVIAVKAEDASSSGTGIMGIVTSPTGNTVGVIGRSDSVVGNGVYGVTTSPTGTAEAISGTAMASGGHGIGGYAVSSTGTAVGVFGKSYSSQGTGVIGESSPSANGYTTFGVVGRAHGNAGIGLYAAADSATGSPVAIEGVVTSSTGTAAYLVNVGGGNILIGRSGVANVFRVDGTGKVYANGGTVSSGADFAESIAVRGDRVQYEPGDVMAIDENGDRRVKLAMEAYSTQVAGIYSTRPGTLSTTHAADSVELAREIPMAVIGIVPCKVTAANGPIHRGDLLVSSSVSGYAMKATDRTRMAGAIIGKAMQELSDGSGVIEVLVTLE